MKTEEVDNSVIKQIEETFHEHALYYLESLQKGVTPEKEKDMAKTDAFATKKSIETAPEVGQKRLHGIA